MISKSPSKRGPLPCALGRQFLAPEVDRRRVGGLIDNRHDKENDAAHRGACCPGLVLGGSPCASLYGLNPPQPGICRDTATPNGAVEGKRLWSQPRAAAPNPPPRVPPGCCPCRQACRAQPASTAAPR